MPLTNYSLFRARGAEGQLVYNDNTIDKYGTFTENINAGTVPIPYGRLVRRIPGQPVGRVAVCEATTTVANAMGISVFYDDHEKPFGGDFAPEIPVGQPVTILRKGVIYVVAETTLTVDQPVFFRISLPTLPIHGIGRVRNDNGGGATVAITLTNANGNRVARALEPATAVGDLIPLYVNFEYAIV